MCLKKGISFTPVHDDVIVPPGDLKTRTAKRCEYTNVEWEYNDEQCEGRTGFPIVDAAMLQMNQIVYMHNRCRMIVASFLAKALLLDWRMGERYGHGEGKITEKNGYPKAIVKHILTRNRALMKYKAGIDG